MKKIIVFMLAVVLCLSFAACANSTSPEAEKESVTPSEPAEVKSPEVQESADNAGEDKPVIGVLIFDYTNAYVSYIRASIEQASEGKAEVLFVDGQNDQAKQAEQVDTMLQKGVDALCINVVQVEAAGLMIEKCKDAGIPVVFFNRSPSEAEIMGYEKCYYVGVDPKVPGVMQAEMVMDFYESHPEIDKNGDGALQYVILEGTPGHPDAKTRTESVINTFKEAGFAVELLDKQPGDFQTPKAKDVMDAWIGKYGDGIELVVSNNDAMLLGAVESLKGAGYLNGKLDVACVGINALPETLPYIDEGTVMGSIMSNPAAEGRAIFQIAYNCTTGADPFKDVEGEVGTFKDVRIPFKPVDASNTNDARDAYGLATE